MSNSTITCSGACDGGGGGPTKPEGAKSQETEAASAIVADTSPRPAPNHHPPPLSPASPPRHRGKQLRLLSSPLSKKRKSTGSGVHELASEEETVAAGSEGEEGGNDDNDDDDDDDDDDLCGFLKGESPKYRHDPHHRCSRNPVASARRHRCVDPSRILPAELVWRCLSFLDAPGLLNTRAVSTLYKRLASSDGAGWSDLCAGLWRDKVIGNAADWLVVMDPPPSHLVDSPPLLWRLSSEPMMRAYYLSLADSKRQYLTLDELVYDSASDDDHPVLLPRAATEDQERDDGDSLQQQQQDEGGAEGGGGGRDRHPDQIDSGTAAKPPGRTSSNNNNNTRQPKRKGRRNVWSFRFKVSAGAAWTHLDPWHSGRPCTKLAFLRDGTVRQVNTTNAMDKEASDKQQQQQQQPDDPDAGPSSLFTQGNIPRNSPLLTASALTALPMVSDSHDVLSDPPWPMRWRLLARRPMDLPARPFGSYLRLTVAGRDVPTYSVSRCDANWGFTMESCWGLFGNFELPPLMPSISDALLPTPQAPLPVVRQRRRRRLRRTEGGGALWVVVDDDDDADEDDGQDNDGDPLSDHPSLRRLRDDSQLSISNEVQWREAFLYNVGARVLPEGDDALDEFDRAWQGGG
jgi:hypothetical protein